MVLEVNDDMLDHCHMSEQKPSPQQQADQKMLDLRQWQCHTIDVTNGAGAFQSYNNDLAKASVGCFAASHEISH